MDWDWDDVSARMLDDNALLDKLGAVNWTSGGMSHCESGHHRALGATPFSKSYASAKI